MCLTIRSFNIRSLVFIFIFLTSTAQAQKEANIWYFGEQVGLDFNGGSPTVIKDCNFLGTYEGVASIADKNGELLFYSDGHTIWNKDHLPMPNGLDLMTSSTVTQLRIIPKPNTPNIYYLIHSDDYAGSNQTGIRYTEIDMSLQDGYGDVTSIKNKLIHSSSSEKIATIKHENNCNIWVITHPYGTNDLYSYLVTPQGISADPIVSKDVTIDPIYQVGYLRGSPNGKKIASALYPGTIQIFDFDNMSGLVSNSITLSTGDDYSVYGLEFSSNSKILYVGEDRWTAWLLDTDNYIVQYNLDEETSTDIINSRFIVENTYGVVGRGALSRGPNEKIYHTVNFAKYLDVINSPNSLGSACDYSYQGIDLQENETLYGLPQFLNHYYTFYYNDLCLGDTTSFELNADRYDSVYWDFGDVSSGTDNYSSEINPKHFFQTPGQYLITLRVYNNGNFETLSQHITINELPKIKIEGDTIFCKGNNTTLNIPDLPEGYSIVWSDGTTDSTIKVNSPNIYWAETTFLNCKSRDSINVITEECITLSLIMPNVFTPNNDGKNDSFIPLENIGIKSAKILIYDRWGKILFSSSDLNEGWNGKYNEKKSATGTYFWTITYYPEQFPRSEKCISGTVALLRQL